MTCKLIEEGKCSKDFNCEYFKYEPIPSRIPCYYKEGQK